MTNEDLPQGYIGKENVNAEKKAKHPKEWKNEAYKTLEKIQKYKVDNYIPQTSSLEWVDLLPFC